jgi:hypothetical protein
MLFLWRRGPMGSISTIIHLQHPSKHNFYSPSAMLKIKFQTTFYEDHVCFLFFALATLSRPTWSVIFIFTEISKYLYLLKCAETVRNQLVRTARVGDQDISSWSAPPLCPLPLLIVRTARRGDQDISSWSAPPLCPLPLVIVKTARVGDQDISPWSAPPLCPLPLVIVRTARVGDQDISPWSVPLLCPLPLVIVRITE